MPNPTACTWNGVRHASIHAAALANGIAYDTMRYRLRAGYTCDSELGWTGYECEWNGRKFRSQRAAARAFGISKRGMEYRINMGYKRDSDMKRCQKRERVK